MKKSRIYGENIFMIAIELFILKTLYSLSKIAYVEIIDDLLLVIAMLVSVLGLFLYNLNIKAVFFSLIGILLFWGSYINNNFSFFITYMIILLLTKIDFQSFMERLYKFHCAFIFIHIMYSMVAFWTDRSMVVRQYAGGEFRFLFGLAHPNLFSMICIVASAEKIWLSYNKMRWYECGFMLFFLGIIYFFTKTDALTVMGIFFLLTWYSQKHHGMKKMFRLAAMVGFPVFSGVTILTAWLYTKEKSGWLNMLIAVLDKQLSRRIAMFSYALKENSIHLFAGQFIKSGEWSDVYQLNGFTVDNAYLIMILQYGLFIIFLISVALFILAKEEDDRSVFPILVFILYGIIESQVIIATILPSLALISKLFLTKQNKMQQKCTKGP